MVGQGARAREFGHVRRSVGGGGDRQLEEDCLISELQFSKVHVCEQKDGGKDGSSEGSMGDVDE